MDMVLNSEYYIYAMSEHGPFRVGVVQVEELDNWQKKTVDVLDSLYLKSTSEYKLCKRTEIIEEIDSYVP